MFVVFRAFLLTSNSSATRIKDFYMKSFLKYGSLFAVMFLVTAAVVTIETGHISSGLTVGCIAGPLKFVVAALHGKFFE